MNQQLTRNEKLTNEKLKVRKSTSDELKELQQQLKELQQQLKELQQQLEPLPLEVLLKQGKLLVLMDGLDEVPNSELRQVVQSQLREIAKDYPKNRFILSCRNQIITSIPDGFTSVEVADFSSGQIGHFVRNWFTASGKSDVEVARQWKMFKSAIGRNPALNELTVTPVLLSLMCLVLQDEGEMPSQVNWLYEKGIKLLLSKWNAVKEIEEWELGSRIYGALRDLRINKLPVILEYGKCGDLPTLTLNL